MPASPDQQRSRPDFNDPADVAYELSELRGSLALLQSQTSGAIQNMTGSVQALQAEVRNIGQKVEEVTRLQINQEQHSDGLARAFTAIRELAESVREGFDSNRTSHEDWREKHVRENQDTREKVIRISSAAMVLSTVAGILVATMMWYSDKMDTMAAANRAQIEATVRDNSLRVRNIEIYLSQGGGKPTASNYTPGK